MMMLVNGAGFGAVVWSQSIQVLPNTTYNFSAWGVNVCCRSGWISTYGNTNPAELAFQFNGVQLGTSFTAATPGEWTQFSGTWFIHRCR
jgi:hypothetical protein